jgi:hypothetical protein
LDLQRVLRDITPLEGGVQIVFQEVIAPAAIVPHSFHAMPPDFSVQIDQQQLMVTRQVMSLVVDPMAVGNALVILGTIAHWDL